MGFELSYPTGAVIIFGATGGIGRTIAEGFAKAGVSLALVWRTNQLAVEQLQSFAQSSGVAASTHQCDVTDPAQIANVFADAIAEHGRLHSMVWGAGPLVEQVDTSEATSDQWHHAINVEVHGFFEAVKCAVSHMRGKQGGSIVHLGSAGDRLFPPKDALSVAPKAANESLIRGIAREEGVHNIRANSVLVGVIEAGMFLELTKQGVFDERWVEEVQKGLALKRWGQPEEVANAALFLASDQSAYITGEQISVAGGYGI